MMIQYKMIQIISKWYGDDSSIFLNQLYIILRFLYHKICSGVFGFRITQIKSNKHEVDNGQYEWNIDNTKDSELPFDIDAALCADFAEIWSNSKPPGFLAGLIKPPYT